MEGWKGCPGLDSEAECQEWPGLNEPRLNEGCNRCFDGAAVVVGP